MVYFDNNATTCPFPEVVDAVSATLSSGWANPSSPHRKGRYVRSIIERAREEIAHSLRVDPKWLTFTSGATESNNTVLSWVAEKNQNNARVLVSTIEHPSILAPIQHSFPKRVDIVPVNPQGKVDIHELEELIVQTSPVLVSLMAANNETGVLQPWQLAAKICKDRGIWFHCDATQWIGKLDHVDMADCQSFSFSAHKFGGPKGVGVLVSAQPIQWVLGGGQERESRAGTENAPAIEGMRIAWQMMTSLKNSISCQEVWKSEFENDLLAKISNSRVIGSEVNRLWNTSLLLMPFFDNLDWVSKLDKMGFAISTGSACSTARDKASSLPKAIELGAEDARRLVRISGFYQTSHNDWLNLATAFEQAAVEIKMDRERSGTISL